jgi:hypothetical protein
MVAAKQQTSNNDERRDFFEQKKEVKKQTERKKTEMKDEKKLTNSWQVSRRDDCLAWKTTRKVATKRNNVKQWCGLKGQIDKKSCFIKQKRVLKNSQRKRKK